MSGYIKNDDRSETTVNLYASETLCATWISVSLILLTASLLFYDMTKRSSIKIHYFVAAIFAITLMLLSVITCLSGTIDYTKRVKKQISLSKFEFNQEKNMSKVVTLIGILLTLIELGICISIIKSIIV
tara:strand:- start:3 stop:389 length:387 start_codon:yes stop_codon:yes gene_type:complete